jgi:D-alanyl-lipoteichoic acid acyltransferase DltB (MBOAT superfamily)
MAFISREFAIFFTIVAVVYFLLPNRVRWIWLLASSIYFYGAAEPVFVAQIIAAAFVTYYLGLRIQSAPDQAAKRSLLTLGICLLVANLAVFKYTGFLNETFRDLFGYLGLSYPIPTISILLPIGISFYTFLLIGYLVDVFRGTQAERHLGIFSLYVLFFPKLIAGPIERTKNLLQQLHAPPDFKYEQAVFGLQLILWGVFKKAVIADRIAPHVDAIYNAPHAVDGVALTFATFMYAFQLYCDFSGYTDIALGTAAFLGFNLVRNFDRPYMAISIQDFWKRWHISLTSWLTDYVYTPLTRQRRFKVKFYTMMLAGLFVTFVVSGIWHGAQWTFVIWGILHGAYIVTSLLFQKQRNSFVRAIGLAKYPAVHRAVKIATTFLLVCFAYIWFRANSVADAFYISTHLHTGWLSPIEGFKELVGPHQQNFLLAILGIAVVIAADALQGQKNRLSTLLVNRSWLRWGLYYAGATSILLLGVLHTQQQFLYFRF